MSIEELECASHNERYYIITENPTKLSCDHLVCSKCVDMIDCNRNKNILCKKCNKVTKIENTITDDADELSFKIKTLLNTYFKEIYNDLVDGFNKISSNFEEKKLNSTFKIEYLKEEIDIRVESIKTQLYEQAEQLKNKLDNFLISIENFSVSKVKEVEKEVLESIENNTEPNTVFLQKIQETVDCTNGKLHELDRMLNYEISTETFSDDSIAYSVHKSSLNSILKLPKLIIDDFYDFCVLPNGYCLVSGIMKLTVFDQDLKKIVSRDADAYNLSTDEKTRIECRFYRVTCDNDNYIYVDDSANECVLKLNSKLKLVKFVDIKELVNDVELNGPYDICYDNNHLFVDCDNRFVKITTDLNYVEEYNIDGLDNASSVCVFNNLLCFANESGEILFYELAPLKLKFYYNNNNVSGYRISITDNRFCVTTDCERVYFYDKHGRFEDNCEFKLPSNTEISKIENFNGRHLISLLCACETYTRCLILI